MHRKLYEFYPHVRRERELQISPFAMSRDSKAFYLGEGYAVSIAIKHSPKQGE